MADRHARDHAVFSGFSPGMLALVFCAAIASPSPTSADVWDPGDDTAASGTVLAPGTVFAHHGPHDLVGSDKNDWYRIYMSPGSFYHFDTNGRTGFGHAHGHLYSNSSGTGQVASDLHGGYDSEFSLTYVPATAQTYYLRVQRYPPITTNLTWNATLNYVRGIPGTTVRPWGPTVIYECVDYNWHAIGVDAEKDQIKYHWDWTGDGIADDSDFSFREYGDTGTLLHAFTTAGTYTIKVRFEDTNGNFSQWSPALVVYVLPVPTNDASLGVDAGSSFATALNIPPGQFTGYGDSNCDRNDYYRFWADNGEEIHFSLTPAGDSAHSLYLYNPSQLAQVWDSGSTGETVGIDFTADTSGYWYVLVLTSLNSGDYSFDLSGVSVPALLTTSLVNVPPAANLGQQIQTQLTVANIGGNDATNVTPTIYIDAGNTLLSVASGPVPPAPVSIAAGAFQTFTWTFNTTATGFVDFTGTVTGDDSYTGQTVSSVGSVRGYVQLSATLSSAISVSATTFRQGQQIVVILTVTNSGQSMARNSLPVCSAAPAAAVAIVSGPVPSGPVLIGGEASQFFTWTYEAVNVASSPNLVNFTITTTAADNNDSTLLSVTSVSSSFEITPAASLKYSAWVNSSAIKQGETVIIYLSITNVGAVAAAAMSATMIVSPYGNVVVAGVVPAVPTGIPSGGSNVTFAWTFVGRTVGLALLTVSATGVDLGDGSSINVQVPLFVDISSLLVAAAHTVPATVKKGSSFEMHLTVTNTGAAIVALPLPTLTLSDPRLAGVTGVVLPSPVLAPGASATFVWRLSALGTGALRITAVTTGVAGGIGLPAGATTTIVIERRFVEPVVSYPNPVTGDTFTISIDLDAVATEVEVTIFNLGRDLVYTGSWRNVDPALADLDVSGVLGWAPGLYLVRTRAVLIDGREQRFPLLKVLVRR